MKKIKLDNVTLVAMAGVDIFSTTRALIYSQRGINFGKTLLISHIKPWYLPSGIDYKYTTKTKDIYEWCYKIAYDLYKYIETDYVMLVHNDGFVVNPTAWHDVFLEYDYIGAPWPIPEDGAYRDIDWNLIRVGNSVSLRSRKLLELPSKLNLTWPSRDGPYHEDGFFCCNYRHVFLEHGIKYAPLEVAKYFSHESMIPEIGGIKPFAFHKWAGSNSKYPGYWMNKFLK